MPTQINILVVEDSVDDAVLLVEAMKSAGFEPKWKRVETEADYRAGLEDSPDLIISDYMMPQFGGLRAMDLLRERGLDIPFILVSGTVGEEKAVEAMKHGVTDYLLKDRIGRLGIAAERALEQKQLRDERKRMEQQMALQATALETAANAIIVTDQKGIILWVNPAFTALTGYPAGEVMGKTPRVLRSGEHDQKFYHDFWQTITSGKTWRSEFINRRKDGSIYYDEHTVTPVHSQAGKITHFIGIMNDVTERKRAEEDLRGAHAQLRQLLDHSPAVIYALRVEGENVVPHFVSENITQLLDFNVPETQRYEWWVSQLHPQDRDKTIASVSETLTHGTSRTEYRLRHKNGDYRWVDDNRRVIYGPSNQPVEIAGIWTDITERKLAEAALRASEERFALALRGANDGVWDWNLETDEAYFSPRWKSMLGYADDELENRLDTWKRLVHPEDRKTTLALAADFIEGRAEKFEVEFRMRHKDGHDVHILSRALFYAAGGKVRRLVGTHVDISERKRAEGVLRESERRFREMLENVTLIAMTLDKNGMVTFCNDYLLQLTGWKREEIIGADWFAKFIPEANRAVKKVFFDTIEAGKIPSHYEHPIKTRQGELREIVWNNTMLRDADGSIIGTASLGEDVTEHKKLEAQLRQSQKMEAIGQLAAGVAHDFNNMLAVIHGNAEMALMFSVQPDDNTRECVNQIIGASERAASLTRQLLAFGRKQTMQPQPLNLNDVISHLTKMLTRVIGENISLQCAYATRLPVVQADVGMMEQVLLNLVVNARDAMLNGGQLLIKTEPANFDEAYAQIHPEARAGEFICLSVSDTGTGITPENLPRIFEPFYTTKEVGKGTGLGLATVHGIVKQHEGWIEVVTQPGAGTTFKVFLPAIPAPATEATAPPAAPALRGGTETILLVEDDSAVRLLTQRILEAYDYRVIEAASGRAAMEIWRSRTAEIDLLLTDIVMPDGVTGRQLAEALFVERPALKAIFMSGYSVDMADKDTDFIRRTKGYFLQKPFSTSVLIQTVRKCLDEKEAPRGHK